ncbi:MAG TPA: TetR family transcriptional regulator [Nocardioides sp.]|uniref:TetR family transcriptional regulator n=1 Tax=Nocardioides sp. TaxID=35761 RepID=UPI002EDA6F3C
MTPNAQGERSRGRPVEIDPARLSQVAVELFSDRGFDAVSAAEVAEAAEVSRRSLFRYFPTKASLVWDGFQHGMDVLHDALARSDHDDPRAAVLDALAEVAANAPDPEVIRIRLRIIASNQDLIAFGSGYIQEQCLVMRDFLVGRGMDLLEARVAANVAAIASFTGYLHWATATEEPAPLPTVRRALDAVRG